MKPLFCLLTILLLVSCKSTPFTPINSGSNPEWTGAEHNEVLVIMFLYNPGMRALFEDKMVAALKKEGVNAMPSYRISPEVSSLNTQMLTKFLTINPKLAILTTQVKAIEKEQLKLDKNNHSFFRNSLDTDLSGQTFMAMMESALYIYEQPDAVWWNRIRVETKEQFPNIAEEYARNEIKSMQKGGAIKRMK